MKPDTSKKLSFHKCLSDSHETLQEDVPEIKSSLSGNISNFMKINQCKKFKKLHKFLIFLRNLYLYFFFYLISEAFNG